VQDIEPGQEFAAGFRWLAKLFNLNFRGWPV
jgi:hypothetical protein